MLSTKGYTELRRAGYEIVVFFLYWTVIGDSYIGV